MEVLYGVANFALAVTVSVAIVVVVVVVVPADVMECIENFVSIYLLHELSVVVEPECLQPS